MKLLPISVVASIAPLFLQKAYATVTARPQSLQKREVVYVTVTEIRYMPMAMPTQAPVRQAPQVQSQAFVPDTPYFTIPPYPPQVFAPPANTPAPSQAIVPAHVNTPAPVAAIAPARMLVAPTSIPSTANPPPVAWNPPPANALTFTSHVGLLSTAEPGFYPTQLDPPSPTPVSVPTSAPSPAHPNAPPQGVSIAPSTVYTPRWTPPALAPSVANPLPSSQPLRSPLPTPLPASLVLLSSPTPIAVSLPVSATSAVTLTSPADRPASSAATASASASQTPSAESSSLSTASRSLTTNFDKTASQATLDMDSKTTTTSSTVSTTTTTMGSTTRTTTSVGSDGTTTVMTEYPTSTRRVQSTSGAQPKWARLTMQSPTVGSTLGYLTALLIPTSFLSVVVITIVIGLTGVLFVL